jgi:hypothetical protein
MFRYTVFLAVLYSLFTFTKLFDFEGNEAIFTFFFMSVGIVLYAASVALFILYRSEPTTLYSRVIYGLYVRTLVIITFLGLFVVWTLVNVNVDRHGMAAVWLKNSVLAVLLGFLCPIIYGVISNYLLWCREHKEKNLP